MQPQKLLSPPPLPLRACLTSSLLYYLLTCFTALLPAEMLYLRHAAANRDPRPAPRLAPPPLPGFTRRTLAGVSISTFELYTVVPALPVQKYKY